MQPYEGRLKYIIKFDIEKSYFLGFPYCGIIWKKHLNTSLSNH